MKKYIIFPVLLFFTIACAEQSPEQVVKVFFNAYENGDGTALINCMSIEAQADILSYLEELKEAPEESADYLTQIGIQVTAEQVESMSAGDFITALFNSPVYADELPDFSGAEFGQADIYGDRALVPVTQDGTTEEIELVLENGLWKIVGNGMEIL